MNQTAQETPSSTEKDFRAFVLISIQSSHHRYLLHHHNHRQFMAPEFRPTGKRFWRSRRSFVYANSCGMSLIEVMVTAGIMLTLMMIFASQLINYYSQVKLAQASADAVGLTSDLHQLFFNEELCKNAFQTSANSVVSFPQPISQLNSTPLAIDHIDLAGSTIAKVGFPQTGLRIKSLQFVKWHANISSTGSLNTDLVGFQIEAEKRGGGSEFTIPWTKQYTFSITTDSSQGGKLVACTSALQEAPPGGLPIMISPLSGSILISFGAASEYCRNLSSACERRSDGTLCTTGQTHRGWRVPTIEELGIFATSSMSMGLIWSRSWNPSLGQHMAVNDGPMTGLSGPSPGKLTRCVR